MPDDRGPLQVDEVLAAIRGRGECAIVHPPTCQEVEVYADIHDKRAPWRVRTFFADVPPKAVLRGALALGFQLDSIEGSGGPTYQMSRNCLGDTAAAIKAVELTRLLLGVGAEDWLWVTEANYEDREAPPPEPPKR